MSALVLLRVVRIDFRGKLSRSASRAAGVAPDPGSGRASPDRGSLGAGLLSLAIACVLQPILYFISETLGVRDSATVTAGLVLGALPACVAILGTFMLNERLTTLQTLSFGLSLAGVALIVVFGASGGEGGSPRGFFFLLGAVASAALYNIYSRRASKLFTPFETTFAMMCTGAIFFGAISIVRGFLSEGTAWPGRLVERALPAVGGVLYLGVLSSVVAFFFVNFTLSRLKASQSIVFANLTTVVSVAAGVFLRGESFGLAQAAGAVMIVVGVWGTNAASPSRGASA
jgi:drug/metabolite transporter (DMT)-like permease